MSARGRNARASHIVMTAEPADHGPTGPAALARRMVQVPTEAAGVYCRQVVEPGPLAGLRLEQRQLDAAAQLVRLWRDALPGRDRPAGYGARGSAGLRHLSPEEETAAGQAARDYRDALDAVQWQCGVRGVIAAETALIHREPGRHGAQLPAALRALADHFGCM